jgi:hypothetical protein
MSGLLLVNSALGPTAVVEKLGFKKDQLILEVGQAGDCDKTLRDEIQKITQTDLIAEEAQEVVDAVILWWRADDGDLIDELVDAQTYLSEEGPVWLFTPKAGRNGHVEPADIQDAAPTAGLTQTVSFPASTDWTATRLVARKKK